MGPVGSEPTEKLAGRERVWLRHRQQLLPCGLLPLSPYLRSTFRTVCAQLLSRTVQVPEHARFRGSPTPRNACLVAGAAEVGRKDSSVVRHLRSLLFNTLGAETWKNYTT